MGKRIPMEGEELQGKFSGEKSKIYKEKIKREDPDKIKKWAHAAYLKQKEKKKLLLNQN